MLELTCGNPCEDEPASFSRFVLPFAYCPQLSKEEVDGLHFAPPEPDKWLFGDLASRKKYLTKETSSALFGRTEWLQLVAAPDAWPLTRSMTFRHGQTHGVCMALPSLVLFEWLTVDEDVSKSAQPDLLHIGFMIVDLYFPKEASGHVDLDHLLELNELFRYWQRPFKEHRAKFEAQLNSELFFAPGGVAAQSRGVGDSSTDPYFQRWDSLLNLPVKDRSGRHWKLFPGQWREDARAWVTGPTPYDSHASRGWAVYADNRTYVWTCAILNKGGEALRKQFFAPPKSHAHEFAHWIKLLNVDQPAETIDCSNSSTQFERDWAEERTYRRWEELGTFYGFSYHSGAILGPPIDEPPLWKHFGQNYFDQTLLLLYLRVAIFRFSNALSDISSDVRDPTTKAAWGATRLNDASKKEAQRQWLEHFQSLRWSFAMFTNLYQFPLLSNQQQAIEMYSLARKSMDVNDLFKEIQEEIENCHDYLVAKETVQLTRQTTFLSVLAAFGLTLALTIGFFSMDIFKVGGTRNLSELYFDMWGAVIFILVLLLFVLVSGTAIAFSPWLSRRIDALINWGEHVVAKWKSPKSKNR